MRFQELLRPVEQASVPDEIKNRHRLWCNDQINLHLIPLLRFPATVDIPSLLPGRINAPPLRKN